MNISKKNLSKTKRMSKKTMVFVIILVIFTFGSIFVTIQTSASGATLAELENQERELIYEKEKLSKQLVGGFSLIEAEGRSKEMGFNVPERIIYLTKSTEVAKLP